MEKEERKKNRYLAENIFSDFLKANKPEVQGCQDWFQLFIAYKVCFRSRNRTDHPHECYCESLSVLLFVEIYVRDRKRLPALQSRSMISYMTTEMKPIE